MTRILVIAVCVGAAIAAGACKTEKPPPPPPQTTPAMAPALVEVTDHWPRQLQLADGAATLYQPQVEAWIGNTLSFRAAVGIKPSDSTEEVFGVIWGSARTDVDRATRHVLLQDIAFTRSSFPTVADNGAAYLAELALQLTTGPRGISLDRLVASLAATQAEATPGVVVKNDVPAIIVSTSPAILIPVDGKPVIHRVPETKFERVINTRALLLRQVSGPTWYIHVYDGWLAAPAVNGPFALTKTIPAEIDPLARELADQGQVELLDGGNASPKPSLANGAPTLFVSRVPTELIVFNGPAVFEPIPGTQLLLASNTLSDVIEDSLSGKIYLLIAGRWYRGENWQKGPWVFVPSDHLPPDFANIPPSTPAGVVLASVAGTPQAREAAIENSIPQTGTVPREAGPAFEATYDGAPKLAPIVGTPLQYAVNCPTPIIRVDAHTWYALRAGIWYGATSTGGPWAIAAFVPAIIYTIPPTSSLHYVTYAHVYGSNADAVYVGYTPGYFGTVVEPSGVVVYGTGYTYNPWVGTVYYAAPVTYGVMAQPVYNPAVGWAYGFGLGLTTAAVVSSWGHGSTTNVYYSSAYHGYPCCGTASANVYGQYGNVKTSGSKEYATSSSGVSEYSSGSYKNEATGTKGTYSAKESYDPSTGQRDLNTNRTATTTSGGTGDVSHSAGYNYDTGRYSGSSSASATGAGGSTASTTKQTQAGGGQVPASERQTSYTNANTGKSGTVDSAGVGNNHYASADGNVYKNTGDGWQKAGAQGWQGASGDNSWANSEQKAREDGESRTAGAERAGGAGGFAGGGGGEGGQYGSHFGGGGFGDRFGEGGGFGRMGGGGGGFGGRGGGRR